jgi:carboxyl-terminal processing protease
MKNYTLTLCFLLSLFVSPGFAQPTSEAEKNFELLWQLFNSSYASFEEKNIDWQAVYDQYRPQVTASTTEQELYEIFKSMLVPLKDGHVNLRAPSLQTGFTASRPSRIIEAMSSIPGRERRKAFNAMILETLQQRNFKPLRTLGPEYEGRPLFTFSDNGKVGYLRFTRSFSNRAFMHISFLNKRLEKIFRTFNGLEALIIDVRFNEGGDNSFVKKVAGRFVEKKQLSFYVQNRKNGSFGPLKEKYIRPIGKSRFSNMPVVVLTNDKTLSAGDLFTLIMSQLPNVTLIGEPSNGSYSDLSAQKLPNGWVVTWSHQRYLSLEKVNYEGRGTPVDIEVENTLEDVRKKRDSVLKAALNYLMSN